MDAESLSKLAYLQQRGLELLQRKAKLQKARTGFDQGLAEAKHKEVQHASLCPHGPLLLCCGWGLTKWQCRTCCS